MFAGIVGDAGLCDDLERLSGEAEGLSGIPFDERAFWRSDDTALLQQRQWSMPELRRERGILCHAPTGVRLVGWLRIDNRDELRRQLDADGGVSCDTDGGLVLLAWLRWGADLCGHLIGDFAFAIHDPRDRSCLLARDPMGVKPLFWLETGRALAFSTGPGVLADLAGPRLTLGEEWLARYVAGCAADRERTVWNEVRKVPPAHLLWFRDGRAELRRHFVFDTEVRDDFRSNAERLEAYRAVLAEATACRVRTDDPVASELSGGLDSSTVTAHAALAMPDAGERLHGLGFATFEHEPEAILSVSQSVPLASTRIVTATCSRFNTNRKAVLRRAHRHLGAPQEHPDGVSNAPLYDLAAGTEARVLLSGFGGDEFVTVRDGLRPFVELWRARRYTDWVRRFPGNAVTRPLRGLNWWCRHRPGKGELAGGQGMLHWAEEMHAACVLSDGVRETHGIRARLWREAGAYDLGGLTLGQLCLRRWEDRPGLVARLENCTLMAAGHGLDYRWPLLDVRLIAFFLAMPAEETLGPGGMDRYLHREAVAGVLPELVVRHGKSMGPPVRIPDRWRRDGPVDGSVDLRYGDLNATLRRLVDPERFDHMMTAAAAWAQEQRSGSPQRGNQWSWSHVRPILKQGIMRLDRWLSSIGENEAVGSGRLRPVHVSRKAGR